MFERIFYDGTQMPEFFYRAYAYKDDPRNECNFTFNIKANDEKSAQNFCDNLILTYFSEFPLQGSHIGDLEIGSNLYYEHVNYYPAFTTDMNENQVKNVIKKYRKKRFGNQND